MKLVMCCGLVDYQIWGGVIFILSRLNIFESEDLVMWVKDIGK